MIFDKYNLQGNNQNTERMYKQTGLYTQYFSITFIENICFFAENHDNNHASHSESSGTVNLSKSTTLGFFFLQNRQVFVLDRLDFQIYQTLEKTVHLMCDLYRISFILGLVQTGLSLNKKIIYFLYIYTHTTIAYIFFRN